MRSLLATGDEWWRLMPPGVSADALCVLAVRGVRALAMGLSPCCSRSTSSSSGSARLIGAIVTSTLIGTALLTLGPGGSQTGIPDACSFLPRRC
jgi:hypothetical protein